MSKQPYKNQKLIDVFEDTKKKANVSMELSYSYKDTIAGLEMPFDYNDTIEVVNLDTVSALIEFSKKHSCCVLNMASHKKAGGGVKNGAKAQEECLFRCSNLFLTVTQDMYPLGEMEYIYSSDVSFYKDAQYNDIYPTVCDVVTIPAINLNKKSYYDKKREEYVDMIEGKPENYESIMKQKIRAMLYLSSIHVDCIILGAWGCGVFKNHPSDVSHLFKEVLVNEGMQSLFKKVVFAVINDQNSTDNNYELFKETFSKTLST